MKALAVARAGAPVWIGSGLTADNAGVLLPHADGVMVGTALKAGARIDRRRVEAMIAAYRRAKRV